MGTNPEKTKPAQGYPVTILPTIGTTATPFKISVVMSGGIMTTHEPLGFYQLTCSDCQGEGVGEWQRIGQSIIVTFSSAGKKKLDFKLKGSSNTIYTIQDSLYVQELRALTDNDSRWLQGNPDWCFAHPDMIAFDRRDDYGEHKIFTASISTRQLTQHTFDPGDGTIECHQFPLWSPDGSKIAFINNVTKEINLVTTEDNVVQSLDVNGTWPLAWHPDGQRLLIRHTDEEVGVWQFNFDDSSYVEIFPECSAASYSPLGDKIAVLREKEYRQALYVYDAVSFELLEAHSMSHNSAKIAWSPNSLWICTGDEKNIIYFYNVQTEQRVSFFTPELEYVWWPCWSSDGRSIALEATHVDDARSRIWQVELPEELLSN
jgi:Tol biopolymer transport system component